MLPLAASAIREIRDLHAFFEAWLGGSCPQDSVFHRVEAALAPDFALVAPSGQRLARSEVLAWLRSAYGSRRNPRRFRISIDELAVVHCEAPLVVMSCVEAQQGLEKNVRRSLAILREAKDAPCGVIWVALQETWTELPTGASAPGP